MATVIVPAHNESTVISRCLDSIRAQQGVSKVIVACNGCTDDTVEIVRANYPEFLCLDIATPSKVHALNEAEKYIQSWPVFYIDADVSLSPNTVELITAEMANQKLLLAAPSPDIDISKSPWLVKQFYKIWLKLPYIREGVIATCTFVMTEEGRKRFDKFPEDIFADDCFVRSHFHDSELGNVDGCQVHVSAPKTLWSLIKIKTRSRLGSMVIKSRGYGVKKESPDYSSALSSLLFSKYFFSTVIYIALVLVFRHRANKQFKNINNYKWEVDNSSR